MSTPTFDKAIQAYPAEGGYEACRKLQQALDFDRKRSTTFSELVQELVRCIVIQENEAEWSAVLSGEVSPAEGATAGYVHVGPTTGEVPPDPGHMTCTDGAGIVIDASKGAVVLETGDVKAPPNYCAEQVQKMSSEEAAAARPGYFPNFYGVTEEEMGQLRSSEAVTVMRTAKTGRAVAKSTSFKQFMWAVPPDAADILEASGQFKRIQPPASTATMGCTVSEPPPAPAEGPRHPALERALLLHVPADMRPFFRVSVTGTEEDAMVSFGNNKGSEETFRGKLDDVVAHVAALLDATVERCKEQLGTAMTMTCLPKEKP